MKVHAHTRIELKNLLDRLLADGKLTQGERDFIYLNSLANRELYTAIVKTQRFVCDIVDHWVRLP